MKNDIRVAISNLDAQIGSENIVGIAFVAIYKHGKTNRLYTDYIAQHPAQAIGYLTAMCHDLAKLIDQ